MVKLAEIKGVTTSTWEELHTDTGELPVDTGATVTDGRLLTSPPALNENRTLYAATARTATPTAVDQLNLFGRGVIVYVNVTNAAVAGSVTFVIEGKDPLSGTYYTLLSSAALTTTGFRRFVVYPGYTASANVAANDVLPVTWRLRATHADGTNSFTYGASADLIV
jgi:hypothetical protein